MSRWFVGQRARVARGVNRNELYGDYHSGELELGEEVIVAGTQSNPNAGFYVEGEYDISLYVPRLGITGMGVSHTLEPILPDGHKPCEEQFKFDLDRLLEREGVSA